MFLAIPAILPALPAADAKIRSFRTRGDRAA
jgi:hypothetical protein